MRGFAALRRRGDFDAVHRRGNRLSAGPFTIITRPNAGLSLRLGMSISRRVGNAVTRNLIRRRIQNAFDTLDAGRLALDLVIIARPEAADLPYSRLEGALANALRRLAG